MSTCMWYGLGLTCTSLAWIQPLLPLGRTGKRTRTQPGRCSSTRNTSGTVGIEGSSLTCQEDPNVMLGCVDDGSSKMPARGALTCAVKLTPGGSVVEVSGEGVSGRAAES